VISSSNGKKLGGGRPDLAEAGGKNPEALDAALAEVYNVVGALLG
jgi:alanyl-tRNA synthetase